MMGKRWRLDNIRRIYTVLLVLTVVAFMSSAAYVSAVSRATRAYDSRNLIRLHVVANSDGELDQEVKLKVRDEILKFLEPSLRSARTKEEAQSVVSRNIPAITEISRRVLAEDELSYPVQVRLGNYHFPRRDYGEFALPEGDYDALRVVLGEGRGRNWWCVLFPPLCFSDITGVGDDRGALAEGAAVEVFAGNRSGDDVIDRAEVRPPQVRWYFAEMWNSLRGNLMMALSGSTRS